MNLCSRRSRDFHLVNTTRAISAQFTLALGLCAGAWLSLGSGAALAQGRLDAQYEATLAGIAVGKGAWTIEIGDDTFSAAAHGGTAGLLKAFSGGTGSGASQGRIVAVSSLAGLVGVPGRTAYGATKFAMAGFFEALRAEMKAHGVSVTTAYPGVVDTQIRYRGYNAAGGELGKSSLREEGAMPVAECARLIIDGMQARKREVVMTAKGKLGRWLKLLAPGLIEKMALNALKDDVKPQRVK